MSRVDYSIIEPTGNTDRGHYLADIVRTSGLEKTKADFILEKFQDYFKIASDWEQKAKSLVVSSPKQTAEMKMAREGRLFLKQKRVDIEKARKELKEQSLREGKAIDGIANVLKSLIEPIEDYLDRQERFVEIQEDERKKKRELLRIAEIQSVGLDATLYDLKNMPEDIYAQLIKDERLAIQQRIEAAQKAEDERIEKEKEQAAERERMRAENKRLEKDIEEQRAYHKMLEAKQEAKLKKERELSEKLQAEIDYAVEVEAENKKLHAEQEAKLQRAPDKEKLIKLAQSLLSIELPQISSTEAQHVVDEVRKNLTLIANYIRMKLENL